MNNINKLNISFGLIKSASPRWAKMLLKLRPKNALKILDGVARNRAKQDVTTGGVIPNVPGFGLIDVLKSVHAARTFPQLQTPEVILAIKNLIRSSPRDLRGGIHLDKGNRTKLISRLRHTADDSSINTIQAKLKHLKRNPYGAGDPGEVRMGVTHAEPFSGLAQTLGGFRKNRDVIARRGFGSSISDGGLGRLWLSPVLEPQLGHAAVLNRYAGGAYQFGDIPAVTLLRAKPGALATTAGQIGADKQLLMGPADVTNLVATSKTLPLNPLYGGLPKSVESVANLSGLPTSPLTPRAEASLSRWLNKYE
jgi:hypothetical protein